MRRIILVVATVFAVFAVVFLFKKHFEMDRQVAHLECRFIETVQNHAIPGPSRIGDKEYYQTLKAIVKERNDIVHANGYVTLGGWVSKGYRADTFAFYLPTVF